MAIVVFTENSNRIPCLKVNESYEYLKDNIITFKFLEVTDSKVNRRHLISTQHVCYIAE